MRGAGKRLPLPEVPPLALPRRSSRSSTDAAPSAEAEGLNIYYKYFNILYYYVAVSKYRYHSGPTPTPRVDKACRQIDKGAKATSQTARSLGRARAAAAGTANRCKSESATPVSHYVMSCSSMSHRIASHRTVLPCWPALPCNGTLRPARVVKHRSTLGAMFSSTPTMLAEGRAIRSCRALLPVALSQMPMAWPRNMRRRSHAHCAHCARNRTCVHWCGVCFATLGRPHSTERVRRQTTWFPLTH